MTRMDHSPSDASTEMETGGHRGHHWMMVACCIPLIVIALVLVATNTVSATFLIYAVVCLIMMGAMMKMMDRGGMKM
ncbi:MAG TPA: hypothetical protein VMU68_14605 [Acidimicrobiales bacterium]|nr:hypothetical protein [Acidimicrobiales bacterium]